MHHFLTRSVRCLRVHWFWPLALVTLPNCSFQVEGLPSNFDPGSSPYSSVVLCDIEETAGRHCPASQNEIDTGIPLSAAAIALATGQKSDHALDYAPEATGRCGGNPEVVKFLGSFPDGDPECLNCGQQVGPAKTYADAGAVCQAICWNRAGDYTVPPTADTVAFCAAHAHTSTNFPPEGGGFCIDGACTDAGALRTDFADPRRAPDPVVWRDLIGVGAAGGTLTRTAPFNNMFDAGAASTQVITRGDAYVEFTATETNTARLGGLSEGAPPDADANYANINFAIDLFKDGCFYVFEGGTKRAGTVQTCMQPDAFGTYLTGNKFRVNVTDNNNLAHTATITYSLVTASCTDGMPCPQTVFYTSGVAAHYPLRVDSSFRELGGTLTDVRLVRIR